MTESSQVLARWYSQLAASLEAGLGLERSIGALPGPAAEKRAQLQARLAAGEPVDASLEQGAKWLPVADRHLISAAAAAGRLPEMLRRLAANHEESARARRHALAMTIYPLLVAHFGVLAFPVGLLVSSGIAAYATQVVRVLVPLWMIIALLWFGTRHRFRPVLALLDVLPLIGAYRRFRALADLAFTLQAHLTAGARLDIAWLQAAAASGDRRMEPVAIAIAETVQLGNPVSPLLAGRREFPPPFAEFYTTGEQTGKLDESLDYLHRHFRERAGQRLTMASLVYPKLLFAAIAVWVAIKILTFWTNYFRQFEQFQ